ncbi:MAG: nicotinate (nicotinamide) nucleotide adenylyltransferase [Candidatus Saccharimonadales bacterium]
MKANAKIGIYSGSFDPIHLGHITFALQAIEEAGLDKVYFLPERVPRNKYAYEHFGHRVAMIKRAIKPHPNLALLELDDKTFSVKKTLPELQNLLKNADLVFLFGSDKVDNIINWPDANKLLSSTEIVIGVRQGYTYQSVADICKIWPKPPLSIIESYQPSLVSTEIRQSLLKGQPVQGLAESVSRYIRQNWLYVSIP